MSDPNMRTRTDVLPNSPNADGKKPFNWLLWLGLGLVTLVVLFAIATTNRADTSPKTSDNTQGTVTDAAAQTSGDVPVPQAQSLPAVGPLGTAGLATYLAGTEATPRVFVFDSLNFAVGQVNLDAGDIGEIEAVIAALVKYDTTRIRLEGYSDLPGDSGANAAISKGRADAVKTAFTER